MLYRYIVSQSSEFCRHNALCYFSTGVCCYCFRLFCYRFSPETFGYTLVWTYRETHKHILVTCVMNARKQDSLSPYSKVCCIFMPNIPSETGRDSSYQHGRIISKVTTWNVPRPLCAVILLICTSPRQHGGRSTSQEVLPSLSPNSRHVNPSN
jgi:hypothetical protein